MAGSVKSWSVASYHPCHTGLRRIKFFESRFHLYYPDSLRSPCFVDAVHGSGYWNRAVRSAWEAILVKSIATTPYFYLHIVF